MSSHRLGPLSALGLVWLAGCALQHPGVLPREGGADQQAVDVRQGGESAVPSDTRDELVVFEAAAPDRVESETSDDVLAADAVDVVAFDVLSDATTDGSPEVLLDLGPETSLDAGGVEPAPDAAFDSLVDAPSEASTEAGTDLGPELSSEGAIDGPGDAPLDAGIDVVPDVLPDAGPEATVDIVTTDTMVRPTRCAELTGRTGQSVQTLYYGAGLTSSWQALCDFSAMGGPWTLVAKVDPTQGAWSYDGARWTDGALENEGSTNTMRQSAKFRGFLTLNFTGVRLDFLTDTSGTGSYETRSLQFAHNSGAQSLQQLFVADTTVPIVGTTRENWLAAMPTVLVVFGTSLEPNCNRIGFNARSGTQAHRVRVGILADEQMNCSSPASWLGAGGNPTDGVGSTMVAGNRRSTTTMSRRTPSWVFMWLR